MKKVVLIIILILAPMLTGCVSSGGKVIPDAAFKDPAKGVSVPHPSQIEKDGVDQVTTFTGIMDPGLWTEVIAGGGVWSALARKGDNTHRGYCYLEDVNYWGDFLLRYIFPCGKAELSGADIILLSRAGGWAYNLLGKEIPSYTPDSFQNGDKDKIFNKGTTLAELDKFWPDYLEERGQSIPRTLSSVVEVKVGGEGWDELSQKITARMKENYKMASGEIRCGYLPLEEFRQVAVSIPGFDSKERFIKRAKLPLIALPFSGASMGVSAAANIIGDAVVASVDDDWSGYYGRAKVMRHELAGQFRQLSRIYKGLLKARDARIMRLTRELNNKKIKFSFLK
jgi:hypothetical protein